MKKPETKTASLHVRIQPSILKKLKQLAKAAKMSQSDWLSAIIRIHSTLILMLPWPASILRINDKSHWAVKLPHKNKLKSDCHRIAQQSGCTFPPKGEIEFTITFYPPNRRWDRDGMITASKALFDGVADGWAVNDNRFLPTIKFGKPDKNNPRVR